MTHPLIRAEIDLNAVAHNIKAFKRIVPDGVTVMPAVKANGYGHGAIEVSKTAIENGAGGLGVARLEEGVELRRAGIDVPILVFGYTSPENADAVIENDLTITVAGCDIAEQLSVKALQKGKRIRIHFKIDTGMGRIGIFTKEGHPGCPGSNSRFVDEIVRIQKLQGVELEGIYTHFAQADHADKTYTMAQLRIFNAFIDSLKEKGVDVPIRHTANSAAAIEMPETHFEMIRPGISVYGLYPSDDVDKNLIDLKPAMQLKAKIVGLKSVPAGFKVSYGSTYVTDADTVIAVVPIGYADGFSRLFSNNGSMLVHGVRCPIVGRVCMDLTMIDVGHLDNVCIEDEVVIIGRQDDGFISADELAENVKTINYEIVSALTSRVKRVYMNL